MSGEVVLAIVSAVCTCIVTVTTIIVRAQNAELIRQVKGLKEVVASGHALILLQSAQIHDLTSQKVDWKGNEVPTAPNPWNL